ncbi:helix-turn-helix transcriptional regulator [Leptolyngbya sp. AN03gr2]|uniref:helix-turn-helix transcriptional regulator n=1 Tax=Leptolyngbya sp. AN03gr2 TaxID=3423364 RepID=UPI003D31833F
MDEFEELTGVPECLGRGYSRAMELLPGVWLNFLDIEYYQDSGMKVSAHEHLIQMTIFSSSFMGCSIYPLFGGSCSYFSGSGLSPAYIERYQGGQRITHINVEIDPDVLESAFLDDHQRKSDTIRQLFKGEEWKASFYPKVTPEMRSLVQQMWNVPYRGAAKRMYLQAKVLELLAIHLDLIAEDTAQNQVSLGLKPKTIERLHQARAILTTQFVNPPSLPELAQQVGLSHRTLQRGFQTLFDTTIVGYLKQRRLDQAEQLLRQGNRSVAEVALLVGYGHLGHFATAFKRRFGITPSQCLAGKRTSLLE